MLYALCFVLFVLSSLLLCCSSALAEGLSLSGNLNYISTEQEEDGERILTQSSYFRNLYFTFEKPVTPLISYQLSLRTNWSDFRLRDQGDNLTKTYQRAIEPALDLYLRNPIYDFSTGYRRLEQWDTEHLRNEGRTTTEFLYARLNITPVDFPALSLEFNRQKEFDYLSPKTIDITDTRYTANSWYQYLYKGLTLSYNFTYAYDVIDTQVTEANPIEETKNNNFNGLYNVSYFKTFWNGKSDISANYQGNYIRDRTQFFAGQTGAVPFKRSAFGGLYVRDATPGSTFTTDSNERMGSDPTLTNGDRTAPASSNINLSSQTFHNIGIDISFAESTSVNQLRIYVNKDTLLPNPNTNPLVQSGNWRVYQTNTDPTFDSGSTITWMEINNIFVSREFDLLVNRVYYKITFPPTTARFFKAVNIALSSIPDEVVTEIEAWGINVISGTGKFTVTNDFFNQGINLIANLRPIPKLNFSLNYFLNRADQNPVSIWNSVSGVFSNLVSDSISDEDELRSNILRTYGAAATWYTHRLLTTTFRLQRNEAFDNLDETDFSSNTYTLSFNSALLPTLDTNLSFIRNDNYNFGDKDTTNDSVLLSILAKLYRDVNMVTDMVYTRSESYVTDIITNTTSIRGSIDATLTQKLYGSLAYGLSWISTDDAASTSTHAAEGQTIITYRPGRFINISGSLRVQNMDEGTTTSEGILVDWLPVPALRLNLNYVRSDSDAESEPSVRDLLSAYLIWYITKFLDLQVTYSYTREERDTDLKTYTVGANLNWRVW
jgi:hypothetical protein